LFLKVLLATLPLPFPSVRLLNMQFLLVFATFDCCGEKGAEGSGVPQGAWQEESGAAAAAITTTNSENSGDKDKSQQWIISGT